MDERTFERRLLRLIFRSSVPLTPVHLAYHLDIRIAEARGHLDRMVACGVLEIDSDERGNMFYTYPLRPPLTSLAPAPPPRRRRRRRGRRAEKALVPVTPQPTQVIIEDRPASAVAAAALSLFLPGVGQIYSGRVLQGIGWMLATGVGYLLFLVPGLILHICCIVNAALGPPRLPVLRENVA
jgi:TM2 domain-containing membrane protein YozV